jgi:TRAP-type C4-dicarboxylate transport system permease small subunit
MLVLIVALGLGAAAIENNHIKVDLLMDRLSKRAQFIIDAGILSLTVIMLALTTWSVVRVAITTPTRYTIVLHIPDTPFILIFGIGGWGLCCLGALVVLIQLLRKRGKDEP